MGPAHVDSVLHFSAKYMFVSLHTCKAVRSSLRQAQRTLVLMVHAFSILCGLYLLFRVLCVPAQPIESHVLWTGSSWSRSSLRLSTHGLCFAKWARLQQRSDIDTGLGKQMLLRVSRRGSWPGYDRSSLHNLGTVVLQWYLCLLGTPLSLVAMSTATALCACAARCGHLCQWT